MRKKIILVSFSIFFLSFPLLSQNVKIGEVNYYEGSAKICREVEGAVKCEFVRFGMSIFKDDRLITSDGRVEIDFGNNDFLRVNRDSEVIFRFEDKSPSIENTKGTLYLSTVSMEKYKLLSRNNIVEVSTPGKYRIESTDKTSISVINGFAEVTFSDGSFISLNRGEMVEAKEGKVIRGFCATYDSFDRFAQKREKILGIPSKEKEIVYYRPYWYYEPYWMWYSYYYWLPYSYWYYPSFYGYWPYYWYYIPYREVPYFRSDNWKDVLTKNSQVYKGGTPPPSSPVRHKYTSTYSGHSSYHGSGKSSSQGSISKSTISSSHSSSSSSSSGSSGHAKPKDK